MKISIYPSYRKDKKQGNPFINNLYDCFPEDAEIHYVYGRNQKGLINNLFSSKIYIMNWPENVIFDTLGFIQIFVFIACLGVLLVRKVKFVWFFHNIEPHEGHNLYSRFIYKFMLKHSSLIITLSKKGREYLVGKTNATIKYYPHPFKSIGEKGISFKKKYDLYIWGSINKYKGIVEFLQMLKDKGIDNKYRILITGKCKDPVYDSNIKSLLTDNIVYENIYIDNDKLIHNMNLSRYVLFPYLDNSVSSSGALMDSLENLVQVIGPNIGAFKDANEENVCLTYDKYDDIIQILDLNLKVDTDAIKAYVANNQWPLFGQRLYEDLLSIS